MTAMTGPLPYQPPDLTPSRRRLHGEPQVDKTRPWLALRDGETSWQWQRRMSHTCWKCGRYEEDNAVLDRHEAEHEK